MAPGAGAGEEFGGAADDFEIDVGGVVGEMGAREFGVGGIVFRVEHVHNGAHAGIIAGGRVTAMLQRGGRCAKTSEPAARRPR